MSKKEKDPNRIGIGEKLSYLLCNIGNIPLMTLLSTFFLIFYTDVVGLDAGKLATLFLISKIMDGISDPIMGYILDRFPVTKRGKFRPMLILGTIICVINYILLWFGAVWSPVGKYVIVYVTYLLLGWTFDIMDISLNSLLPVMTAEPKERNNLSMIKMIGYVFGAMALSILGPIIVASGTLESYYVLIFGSMAVTLIASIVGVLGVKERVAFSGDTSEKYSFKEMISFLGLRPVIITFIASIFWGIGTQVQGGANAYFFTYIMGDLKIMAGISAMAIVGMAPAMIIAPIVANKLGKKTVYLAGMVIAILGYAIRLIDITSLPILYVAAILAAFGLGAVSTLVYGIQADNTTYVQYRTGKRAEAAVASLSSFITKVGQGVAGAIPGYVLAATGFISGAETQTKAVNNGIIACVIILPLVLVLIGFVIFAVGYNLSKKDVDDMAVEIENRVAQQEGEA